MRWRLIIMSAKAGKSRQGDKHNIFIEPHLLITESIIPGRVFMKTYQTMVASVIIALLVIALTGCTKASSIPAEPAAPAMEEQESPPPQAQPSVQQPPTRTETVTTPPPRRTSPAPEPETPMPSASGLTDYQDSKIKRIIAKADKVTSYAFYYQTSANWNLIRDQYFIRGDKVKVKLYEVNFYNRQHYFDTVYLDTAAEASIAYCENRNHQRCTDQNREFIVVYNDFIIKLPHEWIKEVPYDAVWVGTEQIDNRAADAIEFDRNDGTTVRMKLDSFSGLPREIWVYQGDIENVIERYAFRDFSINSVTAADIEHQFI